MRSYLTGDEDAEGKVRRGLIAPRERFSKDAALWAPHLRVKAFVRKWYLDRRYRESSSTYRAAARFLRRESSSSLPSRRTVDELFGLTGWRRLEAGEDPQDLEDVKKRELLTRLEANDDTTDLSLEDLLEAGDPRNEFNSYCENHGIYDFLTVEFVDALARELRALLSSSCTPTILEVGAGDGSLSHHLRSRLPAGQKIIATDSGSWRIPKKYAVEALDVDAALRTYAPDVVLCSWMPTNVDFTAAIRRAKVPAYVLIGETDDGACGDPWLTWGLRPREEEEDTLSSSPGGGADSAPPPVVLAPYLADGYQRSELGRVSRWQLSVYDSKQVLGNSKTVLFSSSL